MNETLLSAIVENATSKALNADTAEFDGAGFLLYKGKPLDVENESMADLILRKYKAMGINLKIIKDRSDFYFKRV